MVQDLVLRLRGPQNVYQRHVRVATHFNGTHMPCMPMPCTSYVCTACTWHPHGMHMAHIQLYNACGLARALHELACASPATRLTCTWQCTWHTQCIHAHGMHISCMHMACTSHAHGMHMAHKERLQPRARARLCLAYCMHSEHATCA